MSDSSVIITPYCESVSLEDLHRAMASFGIISSVSLTRPSQNPSKTVYLCNFLQPLSAKKAEMASPVEVNGNTLYIFLFSSTKPVKQNKQKTVLKGVLPSPGADTSSKKQIIAKKDLYKAGGFSKHTELPKKVNSDVSSMFLQLPLQDKSPPLMKGTTVFVDACEGANLYRMFSYFRMYNPCCITPALKEGCFFIDFPTKALAKKSTEVNDMCFDEHRISVSYSDCTFDTIFCSNSEMPKQFVNSNAIVHPLNNPFVPVQNPGSCGLLSHSTDEDASNNDAEYVLAVTPHKSSQTFTSKRWARCQPICAPITINGFDITPFVRECSFRLQKNLEAEFHGNCYPLAFNNGNFNNLVKSFFSLNHYLTVRKVSVPKKLLKTVLSSFLEVCRMQCQNMVNPTIPQRCKPNDILDSIVALCSLINTALPNILKHCELILFKMLFSSGPTVMCNNLLRLYLQRRSFLSSTEHFLNVNADEETCSICVVVPMLFIKNEIEREGRRVVVLVSSFAVDEGITRLNRALCKYITVKQNINDVLSCLEQGDRKQIVCCGNYNFISSSLIQFDHQMLSRMRFCIIREKFDPNADAFLAMLNRLSYQNPFPLQAVTVTI